MSVCHSKLNVVKTSSTHQFLLYSLENNSKHGHYLFYWKVNWVNWVIWYLNEVLGDTAWDGYSIQDWYEDTFRHFYLEAKWYFELILRDVQTNTPTYEYVITSTLSLGITRGAAARCQAKRVFSYKSLFRSSRIQIARRFSLSIFSSWINIMVIGLPISVKV